MEQIKNEVTKKKENGNESKLKWLRSRDVRKMLGIGESTLASFRVKGLIPAYKLGDMWYYLEDEINEAILKVKIGKS